MKKFLPLCIFILFFTQTACIFAQEKISLKASQELYYSDYEEAVITPSDKGIYPVRLTVKVESNDKTLYVKIYRATSATGSFELVIDSMQPNSEYFDLYDSIMIKVSVG